MRSDMYGFVGTVGAKPLLVYENPIHLHNFSNILD